MYKDVILDRLATRANVAQFSSFAPSGKIRFSRIRGFEPNYNFSSKSEAIYRLLERSPAKMVNLRTYLPESPQSNPFIYGISDGNEMQSALEAALSNGYYAIINETIDVDDGGVSGVVQGGYAEFAPGVIPRFVEKNNTYPIPVLPINFTIRMLDTVYGVRPVLGNFETSNIRSEFSFHPKPQGYLGENTIIWEVGESPFAHILPFYHWPSGFSQLLGDKAYGLLVAWLLGVTVPLTVVWPRNRKINPFSFGTPTGSSRKWTRTCPKLPEPGFFSTVNKEEDAYALMEEDDPRCDKLASCLIQDEVFARYAGALITDCCGEPILEGTTGFGDMFMLGQKRPQATIPNFVRNSILQMYHDITKYLGPVSMEWAHDGKRVWLLQLHLGASASHGRIIVPGIPDRWQDFDAREGLGKLRLLISTINGKNIGIRLLGNPGITSHLADILRKNKIPSIIG